MDNSNGFKYNPDRTVNNRSIPEQLRLIIQQLVDVAASALDNDASDQVEELKTKVIEIGDEKLEIQEKLKQAEEKAAELEKEIETWKSRYDQSQREKKTFEDFWEGCLANFKLLHASSASSPEKSNAAPSVVPPAESSNAAPPAESSDAAPPAESSDAAPPAESSDAAPPAESSDAAPPAESSIAATPIESSNATPAESSIAAPPVESSNATPAESSIAAPPATSNAIPACHPPPMIHPSIHLTGYAMNPFAKSSQKYEVKNFNKEFPGAPAHTRPPPRFVKPIGGFGTDTSNGQDW